MRTQDGELDGKLAKAEDIVDKKGERLIAITESQKKVVSKIW